MEKENFLKRTFKFIFNKLFKINDTAHKIALGVALGVFCGLFPGTGPLAALFLAFIFRANRAAALFGSLLTNTWLSIITFILAIRVGSVILKLDWHRVKDSAGAIISDFRWSSFLKLSLFDVILPVLFGYLATGLIIALFFYLLTFLIFRRRTYGN